MGTRTEHYTLVPQYGGTLRLPSVRIPWFNIHSEAIEHASLPIKTLTAAGAEGGLERFMDDNTQGRRFPKSYTSGFWLPLIGVFLLIVGYWIGVWYNGRKRRVGRSSLGTLLATARTLLISATVRTRYVARHISPRPYWSRTWVRTANLLPTSVRFWFWVRCANQERDPALWRKTLQFLSWRQLALSPYAPLPKVAEKVLQFQPRIHPEQLQRLLGALDGAIYGNLPLDFEGWKQEFERQVRPGILSLGRWAVGRRDKRQRLPALNPKTA